MAFSFLLTFLTRFSFSSAVIGPAGTAAGTGAGAFGAGAGAFAAEAFVVGTAVFLPPPPPLPTAAAAAEGAFFAPAAPELAALALAAAGAIPGITLCRIALGTNFPTGAVAATVEDEEEEEPAVDLILPTGTAACFEAAISAAKAPVLPMTQSIHIITYKQHTTTKIII
jgi:hypothetical protein